MTTLGTVLNSASLALDTFYSGLAAGRAAIEAQLALGAVKDQILLLFLLTGAGFLAAAGATTRDASVAGGRRPPSPSPARVATVCTQVEPRNCG